MTHHTDMAIAKGNCTLAMIRTLRPNHHGIMFTVAQHLIFSILLRQILWASPAWWTRSPTTLDRLNKVYLPALRWTTGLAKLNSPRKIVRSSTSPTPNTLDELPLPHLFHLSNLFTNQPFTLNNHERNKQKKTQNSTTYPSLHYPLKLLNKIISTGIKLEDQTTPSLRELADRA